MQRKCPNCGDNAVSVSRLMLSDAYCSSCGEIVGVHWFFRAFFFVVILASTVTLGLIMLIDQGPYAALLMISLPIGAIGIIKAKFSPLVVRLPKARDA